MSTVREQLLHRIHTRQARAGVVGFGYVGLPLAIEIARLESLTLDPATIARADCVAILTDHTAFDYDALVSQASLVVDTRNAIKRTYPHVFTLGAPQPAYAAAFVPADASGQAA